MISGAGASAISCAELAISWGVKRECIMLVDTKGVVYKGRTVGMNKYKEQLAVEDKGHRTLADAVEGADVFYGLSVANVLTPEMVKSMAQDPIIFAMANPDPEIKPELAKEARKDVIIATGRSDYANQVNNVLGFPFIFRGALDVRARQINEEMKFAASKALAALAKEDVPDSVIRAYGGESIKFGREYIIPKPLDPRVLLWEAPAVAEMAMKTGVARKTIDIDGQPADIRTTGRHDPCVGIRATPKMWDPGPAWNKFFQADGLATHGFYGSWGYYSVFDADAILHPLYHTEPGVWIGKWYARVEGLDPLIDQARSTVDANVDNVRAWIVATFWISCSFWLSRRSKSSCVAPTNPPMNT